MPRNYLVLAVTLGAAVTVEAADSVPDAAPKPEIVELALQATSCAEAAGLVPRSDLVTVIDYSLPSTHTRLWVLERNTRRILFRELVAHGIGTGEDRAGRFSNRPGSHQTSLGLFVTGRPYLGSNGYSLRLDGLEPGINHLARERAIVMHGAPYATASFASKHGRLGRSWGCPAVRPSVTRELIDEIQGGTTLFAYYPDEDWLARSRFLKQCQTAKTEILPAAP
jgi:hypothetical protein